MKDYLIQTFPAVSEMPNVHPLLVHFPIALLTAYLITEVLSVFFKSDDLKVAAKWMLYLGTLGAVAAAAVGLLGAEGVYHEGEVHGIMQSHRDYGLNVCALALILSGWKLFSTEEAHGFARFLQILIGVVIVANLALGSDQGALMVYKYGVAVDAVEREDTGVPGHSHSHGGGGIGSEINEWIHGLIEREHKIRPHSH